MPRILGVEIPGKKRLDVALTYIYGIGSTTAKKICTQLNVEPGAKADELTDANIAALVLLFQNEYLVEGDLRRQVQQNIRRLSTISCYRGLRHRRGLPVNGQRTKTNARTRKGSKRTVGAIRDKVARKLAIK